MTPLRVACGRFGKTLVIELVLEEFIKSDAFDAGVGRVQVVDRCIDLIHICILNVNEVDLS